MPRIRIWASLWTWFVPRPVAQVVADRVHTIFAGGLDGLIHISELDRKHVNHPSEMLSVGNEIEVYVLNVDRERERVTLSRKRLLPDPWHHVTATLDEGKVVEGIVTDVVPFGAFVLQDAEVLQPCPAEQPGPD